MLERDKRSGAGTDAGGADPDAANADAAKSVESNEGPKAGAAPKKLAIRARDRAMIEILYAPASRRRAGALISRRRWRAPPHRDRQRPQAAHRALRQPAARRSRSVGPCAANCWRRGHVALFLGARASPRSGQARGRPCVTSAAAVDCRRTVRPPRDRMSRAGRPARRAGDARHSSLGTTQIYTHVSKDRLRERTAGRTRAPDPRHSGGLSTIGRRPAGPGIEVVPAAQRAPMQAGIRARAERADHVAPRHHLPARHRPAHRLVGGADAVCVHDRHRRHPRDHPGEMHGPVPGCPHRRPFGCREIHAPVPGQPPSRRRFVRLDDAARNRFDVRDRRYPRAADRLRGPGIVGHAVRTMPAERRQARRQREIRAVEGHAASRPGHRAVVKREPAGGRAKVEGSWPVEQRDTRGPRHWRDQRRCARLSPAVCPEDPGVLTSRAAHRSRRRQVPGENREVAEVPAAPGCGENPHVTSTEHQSESEEGKQPRS